MDFIKLLWMVLNRIEVFFYFVFIEKFVFFGFFVVVGDIFVDDVFVCLFVNVIYFVLFELKVSIKIMEI